MKGLRFLALTLAVFLAATAAYAQSSGRVVGSVLDATGAAVPDADVSLQLAGSEKAVYATKTTNEGDFNVPAVNAATYDLIIVAKGFQKSVTAGLVVNTARTTAVPPIKLAVAGSSQTVEVTEALVGVQTANAEVSNTISRTQMTNLPVIDRDPMRFLTSQAGVNNGAGEVSVNGQKPSFTSVTLDGMNIQDNYIRTNDVGFIPNRIALDQVAEVTVNTSNGSAANPGGSSSVSYVTPSGTNQYHGKLYWSNRNNALKANSFLNNAAGVSKPFLNLNQFGGAFGGPVLKDKLLFYTNYEGYRNHQQTTTNYTVLTQDARNGIFTYKNSAGAVQKVNVLTAMGAPADALMAKYLAMVPTTINNNDLGDSSAAFLRNTAGYRAIRRYNSTRDNITAKLEYLMSAKNSITGLVTWNREILDRPSSDPTFSFVPQSSNDQATKLMSIAWRYNPLPTLTNELRFGFNLAPGIFKDSEKVPEYYVTGTVYSNPVNGITRYQDRFTNTYMIADNATMTKGTHTMQFGFYSQLLRIASHNDASITPSYGLGLGRNTPGLTTKELPGASASDLTTANNLLTSLAGFYKSGTQLFNVANRTSGYVPNQQAIRNLTLDNYALYIQDSWKATRRLTASYGVRWEYYTPMDERDSLALMPKLENNNPIQTILNPNSTLDFAGKSVGRPWYRTSKRRFAPNLGLAYDPTGEGNWVIRAGYSISYVNDSVIRTMDNSTNTNAGLSTTASFDGYDGKLANGVLAISAPTFKVPRSLADNYALNPSGNAVGLIDPGVVSPYVQQWNIGVQHNFKGTLIEVRYVGNHGTKELRAFDYNQVIIKDMLSDFQKAQQNGWLAYYAKGAFNATYNPSIPGSQPLPFFAPMENGGYLTNSYVRSYLQTGAIGELANFYQINQVNAPYNFYRNQNALGANVVTNYSSSSYNGLQVEVTKRLSHGITAQGSYVYSKVLSDADGTGQTNFEAFLDMNNAKLERRRVAGYDLTHQIKANYSYDLPFGKGRWISPSNPIVSRIISGWNLAGNFTMQSGTPFSVLSSRATLNRSSRSTGNTATTFLTKNQLDSMFQLYKAGDGVWYFPQSARNPLDGRAVAADGASPFAGQVFFQPASGTLGTLQRNMFSGPWVWTMDMKAGKTTQITEGKSLELRLDARNVFNHATFYVTDMTLTTASFGKVSSGFYSERALQLSMYFHF